VGKEHEIRFCSSWFVANRDKREPGTAIYVLKVFFTILEVVQGPEFPGGHQVLEELAGVVIGRDSGRYEQPDSACVFREMEASFREQAIEVERAYVRPLVLIGIANRVSKGF